MMCDRCSREIDLENEAWMKKEIGGHTIKIHLNAICNTKEEATTTIEMLLMRASKEDLKWFYDHSKPLISQAGLMDRFKEFELDDNSEVQ